MPRRLLLPILAAGLLSLTGCAASLAASAVGLAVRSAAGEPESNVHLQPVARKACIERASGHGAAVHIIDVEQRSESRIVVWGTLEDGARRLSFQCDFTDRITGFKLRPIQPRS